MPVHDEAYQAGEAEALAEREAEIGESRQAPFVQTRDLGRMAREMLDLQEKLNASLTLQEFEKRAFEHGTCKVGGYGNVRHAPRRAKITITLGNGEVIEYPMLEVPYSLWPRTMQAEFQSIPTPQRVALAKEIAE